MSGNVNQGRLFVRGARRGEALSAAEQYRSYAAECLRLAQQAANEDDRVRLLTMAQAWRELADKFESDDDRRE